MRRSFSPFFASMLGIPLVASCSLVTDFDGLTGADAAADAAADAGADSGVDSAGDSVGDSGTEPNRFAKEVLADNPIAYYPLEEAAGSLATDVVGGVNGTFVGNVVRGVPGVVGRGTLFDGVSVRLEMPSGAFTFPGRAPYSIEVWIVPSIVDGAVRRIAGCGMPDNSERAYVLSFTQNFLQAERFGPSMAPDGYLATSALSVDETYHVVFTYDGSSIALYVNGVPKGTNAAPANQPQSGQLVFGDLAWATSFKYKGVMDEIAIYDKALTGDRVAAHYEAAQ